MPRLGVVAMGQRHVEALVIGGGPGGYVAAIRLGQLGKPVILVERDKLGGICLNAGCIPSKALIEATRLKFAIDHSSELGIKVEGVTVNFQQMQAWKSKIVDQLRSGVAYLCEKNHVEVIYGEARFLSRFEVEVVSQSGRTTIAPDNVIIATGSRPIDLPNFRFDGRRVLSSTEALELGEIPRSLIVIGGGVSGLEIGTVYARLGSKVTIVELTDQLLPGVDPELVRVVARRLTRYGIDAYVKAKAKDQRGENVVVELSDGKRIEVEAEKILVAVGRRPNTDLIGLEKVGVKMDSNGYIIVDKQMRTNIPGVYAIGDVVGLPMLAHKASKQGIVAAEVIAGLSTIADFHAIPSAVFTDPEIATVGMTEAEAQNKGYRVKVGRFPFRASGRAMIARETDGFVKVVAESESETVLGVHIVGPEASNLISEAALAIEMGATLGDIGFTVHPHPTLPESLMEAAEAAKRKAIHIPNP
jgi:dihydrolipoamide dehydrogenase